MLQKEIETRLLQYRDPYLEKDLVTAKAVKHIIVEQNKVSVEIVLGYPHLGTKERTIQSLTEIVRPVIGDKALEIKLGLHIHAHAGRLERQCMPNVKNMIAVASGKGGVGKSTIAVNLALALAQEGAQVGLLDADIYGPSQPAMLGAVGERPITKEKAIQPIRRHGIQCMSIGFLVGPNAAMMWRGPMLGKALEQLVQETMWSELDYLIIDLPPGTGDVQLTLCQKVPVSGAVIVTTPQDLALMDVRRACEMFNQLNVPLLGVIENMSHYRCQHCGQDEHVFGEGGAVKLAAEYGFAVLGAVPLDASIRKMTDGGVPPVVAQPEGNYAQLFGEMARKVAGKLALQARDRSAMFPKIVVQEKE